MGAEFEDLVAEEGGFFVVEFFCGGGHFGFKFFDEGVDVVGGFCDEGGAVVFGGVGAEAFLEGAADGARRDAVGEVVGGLFFAAVAGDVEEFLDGGCDFIGVEDDAAVEVASGAACGLDEGAFGAEVAFFIGVEDADEGDFGQIEAFAEEVDADEDVEAALAEVSEDFDAFDGVDFGVEVADAEFEVAEVVGEVFCGAFCEGEDEGAVAAFCGGAGF